MNRLLAECGFDESHDPHLYVVAEDSRPVDKACPGLRYSAVLYFDGNPLVSRAVLRREDNPGLTFTATELGTGKYRITVDG